MKLILGNLENYHQNLEMIFPNATMGNNEFFEFCQKTQFLNLKEILMVI